MNDNNWASFNRELSEIFSNGKGEAGLDVAVDSGLSFTEFIRITKQCCKTPEVKFSNKALHSFIIRNSLIIFLFSICL